MSNSDLKIHIGCGQRKIHGFLNIDIDPNNNPDLVDDAWLNSQKENSAHIIYACHILEHIPKSKCQLILYRWLDILAPNGSLYISVPNIRAAMARYLINKDLKEISGFLWGGQKTEWDFHYNGFDYDSLSNLLTYVGFSKIAEYNWKETEWFYIDDYSQAYLPHMDKGTGKLMSLNMIAIK